MNEHECQVGREQDGKGRLTRGDVIRLEGIGLMVGFHGWRDRTVCDGHPLKSFNGYGKQVCSLEIRERRDVVQGN